MVTYIKEQKDIGPYIALKDKMISHDSCNTRRRPDLLISSTKKLHLIVECDEKQHSGASYSCETGRMDEIIDEIKEGRIVFIRWNPDNFKVDGVRKSVLRKDRLKILARTIREVIKETLSNPEAPHIEMLYLFYSNDSENITKRHMKRLVYE
jgi:hypothetical protein